MTSVAIIYYERCISKSKTLSPICKWNYRNCIVCVCTVGLKRLLTCGLKNMSVKKKSIVIFSSSLIQYVITSVSLPFTSFRCPKIYSPISLQRRAFWVKRGFGAQCQGSFQGADLMLPEGKSTLCIWRWMNSLTTFSSRQVSLFFCLYFNFPVLILIPPIFFSSSPPKSLSYRSFTAINRLQELPVIIRKHIPRVNNK